MLLEIGTVDDGDKKENNMCNQISFKLFALVCHK